MLVVKTKIFRQESHPVAIFREILDQGGGGLNRIYPAAAVDNGQRSGKNLPSRYPAALVQTEKAGFLPGNFVSGKEALKGGWGWPYAKVKGFQALGRELGKGAADAVKKGISRGQDHHLMTLRGKIADGLNALCRIGSEDEFFPGKVGISRQQALAADQEIGLFQAIIRDLGQIFLICTTRNYCDRSVHNIDSHSSISRLPS